MKRNIQNGAIIDQLLLSENNLGQFLSNDSVPQFAFYKDLRRLDLSLNRIKSLPPMIFNNLTNLEYLNLSSNSLIFVDFTFSNLNKVHTMDISNNLLVQLSREVRDQVDGLRAISNNFSMNLNGNPFQCSCDTLDFLQWILSRRSVFAYFDQYTCIFQSSVRSFEELHHMLGDLYFQCATHLIVKATAGFLSFVVLIIAVSLVLYRHKWDVKFFCLKFVINRNMYRAQQESSIVYQYDAFVAYHKDNLAWVRNQLFEHLGRKETDTDDVDKSRFQLCIHDLNFVPGISIEENIIKAIENSRKTILVLSKSFLKSGWCEFELQMARMESINKGRNIVVAVMLESLPVVGMSSSLRLLIRRNTYIEWSEGADVLFWEKMRKALRCERDEAIVCDCGQIRKYHKDTSMRVI